MRGRSFGTVASAIMPAAPKTILGSAASSTSSTTVAFTLVAAVAIGDLIVVRWAANNLSATTPTATCADGTANSYTNRAFLGVNATAAAGVVGGIFVCKATVALTTANTLTLTLSGAVIMKVVVAHSFTGFQNALRGVAVTASGSSLAPSVTSAVAQTGDLVVGAVAAETNTAVTADADTLGGVWSTIASVLSVAGGTADLAVSCHTSFKIPNVAGAQIFNPTLSGTATDWTAQAIVIPPV